MQHRSLPVASHAHIWNMRLAPSRATRHEWNTLRSDCDLCTLRPKVDVSTQYVGSTRSRSILLFSLGGGRGRSLLTKMLKGDPECFPHSPDVTPSAILRRAAAAAARPETRLTGDTRPTGDAPHTRARDRHATRKSELWSLALPQAPVHRTSRRAVLAGSGMRWALSFL